jgi:hypothetical protein
MYYTEKIIDGILYFKSTPKGEWKQKTPKALTEMIKQLRTQIQGLDETPVV